MDNGIFSWKNKSNLLKGDMQIFDTFRPISTLPLLIGFLFIPPSRELLWKRIMLDYEMYGEDQHRGEQLALG